MVHIETAGVSHRDIFR